MIQNVQLISLPKISDQRGNLTFIENSKHLPFDIKRVYYLYDVPVEADRGEHAHKNLQQLIVPLSGSFELTLNDGFAEKSFILNNPNEGVYICPMIWRKLRCFSPGAVCFVFASEFYNEDDYIRDYDEFLKLVRKTK